MNAEKKLLIKYTIENIIKNIRNSTYEQQYLKNVPIELSHHVLLDYYNLITNNISDQNTTINKCILFFNRKKTFIIFTSRIFYTFFYNRYRFNISLFISYIDLNSEQYIIRYTCYLYR